MIRFISILAETNQAPFDLTEGESELVSRFNIEFATGPFTLFFIAEYINIIIINALTTIIFLGAFHNPLTPELHTVNFTIKTLCLTTLFL
jgi:NADH:ubiquinone oxidoreductase subunit H